MRELLETVIIPSYSLRKVSGGVGIEEQDDGAAIPLGDGYLVVTSDSHTVKPIFFPGGDIGKLAACGTINDLAAMGARPIAMTSAIVVEEGFPIPSLRKILSSMNEVIEKLGVALVAGDTKVVEKGGVDEIIISTAGVGWADKLVTDSGLRPGDKIIVTGPIGNHEIALLAHREGLEFETTIKSDVAPLWPVVDAAMRAGTITAMKDPTRGGLAGALNEIARKSKVDIYVREVAIPVEDDVRSVAEMLGIDVLETTNEGVMVIGVAPDCADAVLEAIRSTALGRKAAIVGEAREGRGLVVLETPAGGRRLLEEPLGSPLPRIC